MRYKFIILFALTLCVGALFFTGTAYASTGETGAGDAAGSDKKAETLTVDAVWLDGDTLHINVTDANTGVSQTLELDLREYVDNSEYVSVQAIDRGGNESNVIYFKNPYYTAPTVTPVQDNQETAAQTTAGQPADGTDQAITPSVPEATEAGDNNKPFTPDGTGTVVDNVSNSDGKEFFSIKSDDGDIFYLIVDRQKTSENVYLLNAVTNNDLVSLAKKDDSVSITAIPSFPAYTATATPEPVYEPTDTPVVAQPAKSGGVNAGSLIFIILVIAAAGGAGYYFKIVRPKHQATETDDNDEEYDNNNFEDETGDDTDIEDGEGEDDAD